MQIVSDLAISLDGFIAGLNQSLENPFGEGVGDRLHRWMFEDAETNAEELTAMNSHSAYIMGRNMFGPGRGAWDTRWRGWWGDDPPYKAPVFVLSHHPRAPIAMAGGTTFTFVTDGILSALEQAKAAAGDGSIGIQGGADVVRQYLRAGLLDELRLHLVPVLLTTGERLFDGSLQLELEPLTARHTRSVTHIRYRPKALRLEAQ